MAETATQTLKAPAYTAGGTERERVELPGELFDGTINMPVMHQAVKAFLANQRLGLAYTRTRGLVTGGNQKPWKQKGTGRARQGSRRSPLWPGGGTVFGPTGRKYGQTVPRQVRALARKSALNARAREDALIVIDNFNYDKPSTKALVSLIGALGAGEKKVLVLTDGIKQNVFLSGRNLQRVHVMPYSDVSTYHILWSDFVLVESNALGYAMESVEEAEAKGGGERLAVSGKRGGGKGARGAKKSTRKAAKAEAKASKPKAKAAKKSSAKKSAGKRK
jgi:large subunit ribosomal protein L4